MSSHYNPGWLTCHGTGKRAYLSRRAAKAVKRGHPGQSGLGVYRCPDCGHWHLGHLPGCVRDGKQPRSVLIRTRTAATA